MGAVRLAPGVDVPEAALDFAFTTSQGPGGQNVNKVATRCRLRVAVAAIPLRWEAAQRLRALAGSRLTAGDEVLIECGETRSALMNREECVRRLSELVQRAMVRPKVRKKTRPSRGSKERRLESKKHRGEIKKRRRAGD